MHVVPEMHVYQDEHLHTISVWTCSLRFRRWLPFKAT